VEGGLKGVCFKVKRNKEETGTDKQKKNQSVQIKIQEKGGGCYHGGQEGKKEQPRSRTKHYKKKTTVRRRGGGKKFGAYSM